MKRRTLDEVLDRARTELESNPSITVYVMVDGEPRYPVWCEVCRADRICDVLTNDHHAVPDFRICTRCGHGVAIDELPVAA